MTEIKHIFEPNPLACGQAVIAMVAGVDVNEVIKLVGKDRETTLADMRFALKNYGYLLAESRREASTVECLPGLALLSLETPKCWHWSLYCNGTVYDPEHGVLDSFPASNRKYYWEITKLK